MVAMGCHGIVIMPDDKCEDEEFGIAAKSTKIAKKGLPGGGAFQEFVPKGLKDSARQPAPQERNLYSSGNVPAISSVRSDILW
jgi:hypothetical protein